MLLDKFEENWSADIVNLRQACLSSHTEDARKTAHRMKSGSANVSARRLSQRCNDIDTARRTGELTTLTEQLSTLASEYDRAIHAHIGARRRDDEFSRQHCVAKSHTPLHRVTVPSRAIAGTPSALQPMLTNPSGMAHRVPSAYRQEQAHCSARFRPGNL